MSYNKKESDMKALHRRFNILLITLGTLLVTSCGMIDMDTDENVQQAYEMQLENDTLYAVVGDSFMVRPVFTPEVVSNVEIFWYTDFDSIIRVMNDTVIAMGEGEAYLHAISVQDRKEDSLLVVVMPDWRFDPYSWPYETVVYADVRYNGEPLSGNMMVGAFVGNECRAIGEVKEWNGVRYTQFRIGSELFNYSEPGEDEVYASETIRFMLYDPATHLMREHPETLTFDGEAHGTLSNLYQLYF